MGKTAFRWVAGIALLAACETAPEPDPFGVRSIDQLEAPEEDGNLTMAEMQMNEDLARQLEREHGQRPRRYNGLFNGNVEAERCFAAYISQVTAYVNERLAARGLDERVDEMELATNFITEGGFYVLSGNQTTGIDGFAALGVDTLVGNYRALKPYLHPTVQRAVERGDRSVTNTNERGESVRSLTDLNIEEGMYANAGMYAWSRAIAAADMADPNGLRAWCRSKGRTASRDIVATNMADLPQWEQMYWTTMYFNTGPGTAKRFLCENWLGQARRPYTGAENSRDARFNAAWRTATYRYLSGSITGGAGNYCERMYGSMCACDRCGLAPTCASCAGMTGCGFCESTRRCTMRSQGCGRHITQPAMCEGVPDRRPCEEAISCADCFNTSGSCGWCQSEGRCFAGTLDGPLTGSCSSWSWGGCPPDLPCTASNCTACVTQSGCGYCGGTNACGSGSMTGPMTGMCPTWTTDVAACPTIGDTPTTVTPPTDGGMPTDGGPPPGCGTVGTACSMDSQCCSLDPLQGVCVAQMCALCSAATPRVGQTCNEADGCCGVAVCSPDVAPASNYMCCLTDSFPCATGADCCGEMTCNAGRCQCRTAGQSCITGRECCGGSICDAGTCT